MKVDDAAGGNVEVFNTLVTCRGSLVRDGGSRVYVDGRDMMTDLFTIETHWRGELESNLTKDAIITIDSVDYLILNYYRLDEDRRKFRFQCQRVS
jgi:hypothetical protein